MHLEPLHLLRLLPGPPFQEAERGGVFSPDLVYPSPFQETPGTPYAALGLEPLPDVEAELALWAEAIRKMGLKATRYDIREFVY